MAQEQALFDPGFIVRTPGAQLALFNASTSESSLIERHVRGDFGEIDDEDQAQNRTSIAESFGLVMSSYLLPTRVVIWVITDADHKTTTLLLPEEY